MVHLTRKILSLTLATIIFLLLFSISASADTKAVVEVSTIHIEYLDNGDSIETVLLCEELKSIDGAKSSSKRGAKTLNYRDSNGSVLWSVTVIGTFSYNGTTSYCTSCSHSTTSPGATWSIVSSSSSRSGNIATATATAKNTGAGTYYHTLTVTLKCNANGVLS